ncbi:MAG: DUF87 domain-containing protein [Candidatus Micrarchaeota archaeon]|nr:DUF87 domain-containing protein [Candidatus Micrarchaeota archaeon]
MFEQKYRIGNTIRTLSLPRFIFSDFVRWRWRNNYFSAFNFEIFRRSNPHIAIVGQSGSGKSNLCKLLLRIISREGVSFILLDPHNEYVESAMELGATVYDASFSGINIFDLEGFTIRERTSEITSMLKRIFRLGDVQSYMLYKCIAYTYKIAESRGKAPNIHDLLFTIKVFIRNASTGEKKMLEALEKRLLLIDTGTFAKSVSLSEIIGSKSIFALSSLHTSEAQSVYIEGFLKKIYTKMLGMPKSGRVRLYIVIDEAEKLGESSIVSRLVAEGRKYGIGIISISQRAKALDRELRSNTSLFVSFAQREPEELNYIANFIAGGNELNRYIEVKKAIRGLGRGRAIALESSRHNPMIVSFDLFKETHRDPTHAIITLAKAGISDSELHSKLYAEGFEEGAIEISLQKLQKSAVVKSCGIASGPHAGTWHITMPRNSAEHDVHVNLISRHLALCGTRNTIYNSSYGPDVIAFVKNGRAAVEYETGLNQFEQAKKMVLERKEKFSEVVVVANDSVVSRYCAIEGVRVLGATEFFAEKNLFRDNPKLHRDAPANSNPSGEEA